MTSDRRHQLVAGGITVAVNLVLIAALVRLSATRGSVDLASDPAIAIHWVSSPEPPANAAPNVPRVVAAPASIEPMMSPPPLKRPPARAARTVAPAVVADDRWEMPTTSRIGPDSTPGRMAAFGLGKNHAFPAPRRELFAMRDASIGGRLERLGRNMLCRDLRLLAKGSDLQLQRRGVSRDVVIRTMQNQDCQP